MADATIVVQIENILKGENIPDDLRKKLEGLLTQAKATKSGVEGLTAAWNGLKKVLETIGITLGIKALFDFVSNAYTEFAKTQRAFNLIAAEIKALGKEAGGAAPQVRAFIEDLSKQTSILVRDLTPGFRDLFHVVGNVAVAEYYLGLATRNASGDTDLFQESIQGLLLWLQTGNTRGLRPFGINTKAAAEATQGMTLALLESKVALKDQKFDDAQRKVEALRGSWAALGDTIGAATDGLINFLSKLPSGPGGAREGAGGGGLFKVPDADRLQASRDANVALSTADAIRRFQLARDNAKAAADAADAIDKEAKAKKDHEAAHQAYLDGIDKEIAALKEEKAILEGGDKAAVDAAQAKVDARQKDAEAAGQAHDDDVQAAEARAVKTAAAKRQAQFDAVSELQDNLKTQEQLDLEHIDVLADQARLGAHNEVELVALTEANKAKIRDKYRDSQKKLDDLKRKTDQIAFVQSLSQLAGALEGAFGKHKAFVIAQGTLDSILAVLEVYKDGTVPSTYAKAALAARIATITLGMVAEMRSVTPGGGGAGASSPGFAPPSAAAVNAGAANLNQQQPITPTSVVQNFDQSQSGGTIVVQGMLVTTSVEYARLARTLRKYGSSDPKIMR